MSSFMKMIWSNEHRAFAVEEFFKTGSVSTTLNKFKKKFNLKRHDGVPGRNTVLRWVNNFKATASAQKKKPPGRTRTIRTPENVKLVESSVVKSPMRSARKHALALGFSDRSVRRILHFDLRFHPYKLACVQELSERDYQSRVNCCLQIISKLPKNSVLLTSDEAHFHLSGFVNKQNFRYWSDENPQQLVQQPLHSKRVTVWCAVGSVGVIGPYFFEEGDTAAAINSDRYVKMLVKFLQPKLIDLGLMTSGNLWFQQDGATAHTARKSMDVLRQMFPSRLLSLRGDIQWPARSPDLSPCDFFLWGYLKERVYKNRPKTIRELKATIESEVRKIPQEMTKKVMESFQKRLQQCVENGGHHLNGVVFK